MIAQEEITAVLQFQKIKYLLDFQLETSKFKYDVFIYSLFIFLAPKKIC